MKKITLTIKEWYLFKNLADFFYEFSVNQQSITIKADSHQLEKLGY